MRATNGWLGILPLLLLVSCVGPESSRPEGPTLTGEIPAVGRPFSLDLVDAGRPVRLEGVPGRVTLVCVLQEEIEQIVTACMDQSQRWGDRVAVVGLATNGQLLDPTVLPFRFYLDPQGEELTRSLNLQPYSQVVVVDVRGRVADSVPLGRIDSLTPIVSRLIP